MKLQITKYLAIELTEPNELIELIDDKDKVEFMQALSCHDVIFEHVADQIINGCTDDGFHAATSLVKSNPSTPLDRAKRRVGLMASDIAESEISNLERALERAEMQKEEFMNKYYELLRA